MAQIQPRRTAPGRCMAPLKILPISLHSSDPAILREAATVLRSGGLVVAPTETRYGLLARGDDREALERLFAAKGRPSQMPTSLFVRGRDEIERFGEVTPLAARIIERFLPGPLTLVIRARGTWEPHVVTNERIGLRWSPSEIIRGLLKETTFPLTATSANLSGQPDAETIAELAEGLGESVQLYLDAGPLKGITSTVVDCSGERPLVLREGAISQELLLANVKDLLPG